MANKKLRFVALIAVVLMLVCMLVACTTTATSSVSYKVTIHSDGQSDIVWDRQTDFPTLSKEHHTVAGLYLDAEYKTAVTPEDLVNMFLTGDIDVYVKYDRIHYSITVHPLNGGSDVIWQNAPGNKIPEFKKVGYVMSGFYFDENCTQQADSVFTEDILENKEVWVKWVECDHKALAPTDWTTDKQATCTEDGLKVATCPTCDKTFEDTIDALGHNQDGSVAHKDANCTETGVVGGTYCTRCDDGRAEAETIIPVDSTKHTFGEWIPEVPATCTTLGTKGHKDCTDCKKSFTANNVEIADLTIAIDKNNHDIEHHTAKAPTCTEIGWDAYDTCKRVGCEYTTYNQLNATGHKYGNVVYDWADDHSTCTAKHVCENGTCEHEETATATVTSHKTQEATCQQVELTKYTATFTASWATTQIVENVQTAKKADHNYSEDWTIDKVATCTVDGSKSHHCLTEGCESKSNETTIVANHTFGEWIEKVPATCETDGTNGHYHCSVCEANFDAQYKELESITISATGHTTTKICTDKDGHWYACVNDGCTYTTQKVDHTWNKGEQTKDPTETEEGEKTYTCTLCWQTKKEYTGKLDHVHTFDTAIWNNDGEYHWHPAACGHPDEKDGYEEHAYGDVTYTWSSDNTTCTAVHSCKCGYSESEKATITTSVTPATCTTAKYTTYTATFTASWATTQIVENVQTDEALGHNQDGSVAHKDANCTETGVVGGTYCTRCDDGKAKAETIIPVDPTKHTFGEWILEVPATCTSTGTKGHKDCSVCGKHFDNEGNEIADLTIAIDTNNHDIEDHPAKEATCTEPGWYAYVTCKREGCEYSTYNQLNATGHKYGTISYDWNDEHTAIVATRVCKNDASHVETETTNAITSAVTKNHSCTQDEVTTYTATFADAKFATTQTTDVVTQKASHTYGVWVDEVPATCTSTGTKGHKDCSVCGKHFDNEGNEIADKNYTIAIKANAHKYDEWTSNGDGTHSKACEYNAEHKETLNCSGGTATCLNRAECSDCHAKYGELGKHNYGEWIKKADPSCFEEGTLGHYHCSVCEKNFDAEYVELSNITIDKASHTTQHTEKVDATCSADGNIEYWYCTGCETYFSDEACTKTITVNEETDGRVISATRKHAYKWIAVVPATETENGTKGHWECKDCDKVFNENYAEVQLDSLSFSSTDKDGYTLSISINDYATNLGWGKSSGSTNNGRYFDVLLGEVAKFKLVCTDSNSGKWFSDGWRTYLSGGCTYTIATEDGSGYQIATVKITYSGSSKGTLKNGTTSVKTGDVIDVNDKSITLSIDGSSGAQVKITGIEVVYSILSDEEIAAEELAKAQEAANELKLDEMKTAYSATGTYDSLPTTNKNGATVTWSVDENDYCSITEDGKLSIDKIESQTITLSVAVKVGGQTVNKTVDITISADTLQYKLNISDDKTYIVIEVKDAAGTISGGTMVDEGTELIITVTNNDSENYAITKVLAGTTPLSANEDGTYSFTMTEATTISVETKLNLVCKVEGATLKTYDELKDLTPSSGDSTEKYYTIGYVKSIENKTYGNLTIEDATGITLVVYGTYSCDGLVRYDSMGDDKPVVGDVVVLYGVMTKYNSTYELKDARMLQRNLTVYTPAKSTITVDATNASNATVSVDTTTVESRSDFTATNGSVFTFTVTVENGYEATVTATAGTVTAGDNGVYTITVTGNTTITITTAEKSASGGEGSGTTSTTEVTMSFADTTQRTSLDSNSQVWTSGELTFTNNKGASTSSVTNYSNPVRLYKNSTVIIEAKSKITKIVFTSDTDNKYKTALNDSISGLGKVSVNNNVYELVLTNPSTKIEFKCTAQIRLQSMVVTVVA